MAATVISSFANPVNYPTQTRIFMKRAWGDAWTLVPFLHASKVKHCIAPDLSECSCDNHFGYIQQPATYAYDYYYPLCAEGSFILVLAAKPGFFPITMFLGVVETDTTDVGGNINYASGTESIVAYGMERILQHCEINRSIVDGIPIDRDLKFNHITGRGLQRAANRSTNVGSANVYEFSIDGESWTNLNIAEYLLYWFVTYETGFDFRLCGEIDALNAQISEHDLHGMNVFEALNQLINPKRGLAWRCIPDVSTGIIWIDVVSILSEPFALNGIVVPANREQELVFWDGDVFAKPKILFSDHCRYDEITVLGDPITTTATFSIADGTLTPDWTSTMEDEYKAGSTQPSAETEDDDAARAADKFKDVYQKFRVPADWDGSVHGGVGALNYVALPGCDDMANVTTDVSATFYNAWKPFESRLPWLDQTDLSDDRRMEYAKFLAFVQNPEDSKWHLAHRLDAIELSPASVELGDVDLAFWIKPKLNHVFAKNSFDSGTYTTNHEPEIDYNTLVVTGMFETDVRLKANVVLPHAGMGTHFKRKVIICRGLTAHYVSGGTVMDAQDGYLIYYGDPAASPGFEKWDGDQLLTIAAFAAAYYGSARHAVELEINEATAAHFPGSMISAAVGGVYYQPIGTVVSTRTIDFIEQKTHVSTSTFELNLNEMRNQLDVGK